MYLSELSYWKNLSLLVLGMLATAVDTLLRASFMAYSFTIFKLLALVLVPIYFGFMLIGICIRKWKLSINRFELFAALRSFGCSAGETEKVSYKLRPISKFIFALIFLPSMVLLTYTTSHEPNIGIGVNANNTCLAYSNLKGKLIEELIHLGLFQ